MKYGLVFLVPVLLCPAICADEKPPPNKPTAEGVEFFEKKVRPVLVKYCYSCHSANAKKLKGDLRLDTRAGVQRGGATGPVIVPGKPKDSLLIKAINGAEG